MKLAVIGYDGIYSGISAKDRPGVNSIKGSQASTNFLTGFVSVISEFSKDSTSLIQLVNDGGLIRFKITKNKSSACSEANAIKLAWDGVMSMPSLGTPKIAVIGLESIVLWQICEKAEKI